MTDHGSTLLAVPASATEPGVASLGQHTLVRLLDDSDSWFDIEPGVDLFEPNCFFAMSETGLGSSDHPLNAYNTDYLYCRTAVRVRADDIDPNPLIAQVTNRAVIFSLRLVALVCDVEVRVSELLLLGTVPATPTYPCAVALFVHPATGQGFVVVDGIQAPLPMQVRLRLTAGDYTRTGWITILPPEVA